MDMQETINWIVNLSYMPCSVIIIGIGDNEFDSMQELDSDNKMLKSYTGKSATRDIVQFVPFTEAVRKGDLAAEVLKEIPR